MLRWNQMDHSIQVTCIRLYQADTFRLMYILYFIGEEFFHESIIFFFFIDVNQLKDTTIISRRPNSKRLSSLKPSVSKIQSTRFYCWDLFYLLFESTFLFLPYVTDNTLIILYIYILLIIPWSYRPGLHNFLFILSILLFSRLILQLLLIATSQTIYTFEQRIK